MIRKCFHITAPSLHNISHLSYFQLKIQKVHGCIIRWNEQINCIKVQYIICKLHANQSKYTMVNADFDIAQVERHKSANRKKKNLRAQRNGKIPCRKQDPI